MLQRLSSAIKPENARKSTRLYRINGGDGNVTPDILKLKVKIRSYQLFIITYF